MDKQRRWKAVRNYLQQKNGIKVNFSDKYSNYYACFLYTTKEDKEYLLSEDHPLLNNTPRTLSATDTRRQGSNKTRRRSFDALDLSEIIVKENIRTKQELLRLAQAQKTDGKRDLALYVLNNIDKCVKILETTGEMDSAKNSIERSGRHRIDILQESTAKQCDDPHCQWLTMAKDTLQNNGIVIGDFAESVRDTIIKGRGKEEIL